MLCNFNRTRASIAALFLSQCSGEFLRHFELLLTDVVDTIMKVTVRIVQLLLFSLLVCGRHIGGIFSGVFLSAGGNLFTFPV